jgi:hypothetical protein
VGKTIFAAVVAAVLASVATVLVMESLRTEREVASAKGRALADETAKIERERLERRIVDLEKRPASAGRAERRSAQEPAAGGEPGTPATAAPAALAPDGTPYVSRAQMEAYAKAQAALLGLSGGAAVPATPVEQKSLEDIARDMNLSAGEEANLRNILRDAEEEMIHNLCGDMTIDEVKRQVQEAKEDPDKQAALAQVGFTNAVSNAGKLMTWESRLRKRVERVLGPEKTTEFLAKPRKPVIDADLDDLLEDWK